MKSADPFQDILKTCVKLSQEGSGSGRFPHRWLSFSHILLQGQKFPYCQIEQIEFKGDLFT